MSVPPTHPERRIRFDGTITAGNILTAVGMLLALVVWGLRLEGRVDLQERAQTQLERVVERNDGEIKQALRDMSGKIDRMLERLTQERNGSR